jgi:cyclopropane fatty-acyl-phospholipid synthase-like methyltransferase
MEANFKFNMGDMCSVMDVIDHINWGDHFSNSVRKYSIIADSINTDKDVVDNKTTHLYKEALQRKYYGMVESLWNSGLLKEDMKIIDLGCGLCTTLYNLNLQFKKYELKANFYGVDHNEELLKLFTKHLSQFWTDNKLHVGPKDIMECDLSDYDLILSYQPFKVSHMDKMYDKVFKEMKAGSIFHEHNAYKDCREVLINSSSKNNMEEKVLLFGGEKQTLFIKR